MWWYSGTKVKWNKKIKSMNSDLRSWKLKKKMLFHSKPPKKSYFFGREGRKVKVKRKQEENKIRGILLHWEILKKECVVRIGGSHVISYYHFLASLSLFPIYSFRDSCVCVLLYLYLQLGKFSILWNIWFMLMELRIDQGYVRNYQGSPRPSTMAHNINLMQ